MHAPSAERIRIYTILGVALAMFLGALDQTIVSTALPRIVDHLSGLDRYTWVTTIYLLISTVLVPIYGKLADLINRKTLQLWSVSVFLLGSFLCGLAGEFGTLGPLGDGMSQLIVFRGIQALGGAGIFALAFIIVADLYPPRERGKISGIFGSVFGLASIAGPLIGGFLTDHAGNWIAGVEGWRWIFYVNLPLGIIALVFIVARMPKLEPRDNSHKLNVTSALLMVLAFMLIILALQLDKTLYPWTSPTTLGLLAGGLVVLALWAGHTSRSKHPILDLRLFANRVFLTSNLASFFFGAGFIAVIIFFPLYMVNVQGVSATRAGASVIPLSMGMVFSAGFSGFAVTRIGKYKGMMIGGALVAVAGALLMTLFLNVDTPYWAIVSMMVLVGIGFGPAQSLYSLAVQNSVPPQELGQATSANQFTRQIGSTIGAAVVGAIFSAALGAAFIANMPANGAMPRGLVAAGPGHVNSRGLSETRAEIEAGFDQRIASMERLFALRGAEARTSLDAFLADAATPPALRARLAGGTPALRIDAAVASFAESVEKAAASSDARAIAQLLAAVPAGAKAAGAATFQPGAFLGPEQKGQLVRLPYASPAERAKALAGLRVALSAAAGAAVIQANAAALPPIRESLEAAKKETADAVIKGMRKSFSDSIHRVWIISVILMLTMLSLTLLIPNIPLRTRNDPVPGKESA